MNVIIVFPKTETAAKIRALCLRSGYETAVICTTAAGALSQIQESSGGVIICSYRLRDGMAVDIYREAHPGYQMILIGPVDYIDSIPERNIYTLATPLYPTDLLSTLELACRAFAKWRHHNRRAPKPRSEKDMKLIAQAKELLMERNHFTEDEAHKFLQRRSMDNGITLVETAQMILSTLYEC